MVLWIPAIPLLALSYGAITLCRAAFQRTSDWQVRGDTGPNPTYLLLTQRVRFALYRFHSPLLTASQLLSLPVPTKMLQSGTFALLTKHLPHDRYESH